MVDSTHINQEEHPWNKYNEDNRNITGLSFEGVLVGIRNQFEMKIRQKVCDVSVC